MKEKTADMGNEEFPTGSRYSYGDLKEIARRYRQEVERATRWRIVGVTLSNIRGNPELVLLSPGWSTGTELDNHARFVDERAQEQYEAYDEVRKRLERTYGGVEFGIAGGASGTMLARELVRIAKILTASASVGSRMHLVRDVHTKAGTNFNAGEEVRLVEYTKNYPYLAKFEGEEGKRVSFIVESAWKVLREFPKPPSLGAMQRWSNDGVAKSVDGARVEPDGFSPGGAPSWLLVVGVI